MPAHKIVNDHLLDRFHRLVGKPPTSCGRNTAAAAGTRTGGTPACAAASPSS